MIIMHTRVKSDPNDGLMYTQVSICHLDIVKSCYIQFHMIYITLMMNKGTSMLFRSSELNDFLSVVFNTFFNSLDT